MPCQIGITTDLVGREMSWRRERPTMYSWQVLETGLTRPEAQAKESLWAAMYGCESHPGGNNPAGGGGGRQWSVYMFHY